MPPPHANQLSQSGANVNYLPNETPSGSAGEKYSNRVTFDIPSAERSTSAVA